MLEINSHHIQGERMHQKPKKHTKAVVCVEVLNGKSSGMEMEEEVVSSSFDR